MRCGSLEPLRLFFAAAPMPTPFVRPVPTWASVAVLLSVCAACGTPTPPAPPKPQEVLQNAGRASVVVSGSQSGARVLVETNQELRIELASTAGMVSSNLEWMLVGADPKVLGPLGPSTFERAPRDVNIFESAGTTIWRFKPRAPGTTSVEFALRRPRSLDAPSETVRYDVTVK